GSPWSGRQHTFEWLYQYLIVDASGDVRVLIGPCLCLFQRIELGDHQAAGEAGTARIVRVDGRMRAGEYQATGILQCMQAGKVVGAGGQAGVEGAGGITGDDGV